MNKQSNQIFLPIFILFIPLLQAELIIGTKGKI